MKSWINLVFVSGLSCLAFASSLIACLNDSELVSREREFRATYLRDSAGTESTSADSRNALSDSWYTGPTEAELRTRLNLWWRFGAGVCVTAFLIYMSAAARSQHRLKFVLWLPLQLIGIGISMLLGMVWSLFCYPPLPVPSAAPFLAETYRLPHHVPYQQGGISFRFQMIHDVLRERFLNHSPAWYEARNQSLREELRKLSTNNPKSWPLIDDLAVGMDRLGKPEAAIPMLREKLAQQQAQQIPLSGQYTSLANLGTLLIHSGLMNQRLPEYSLEGLRQLKEGIELIREAVKANPEAHFGREKWQLRIAEFLYRAASEPELLKQTDCLGNRLDLGIEDILNRESNWCSGYDYGRPNTVEFTKNIGSAAYSPLLMHSAVDAGESALWEQLQPLRKVITRVGYETRKAYEYTDEDRVAFDRPMLGIIGMWREGGGANPHFSLAIAETMLRVGQRYLAWEAYERTVMLSDRYSVDANIQRALKDHCLKRQQELEQTWAFDDEDAWRGPRAVTPAWQAVSPPPPRNVVLNLGREFRQSLKEAEQLRSDYHAFEDAQLNTGVHWDDSEFDDGFDRQFQPSISIGAGEGVTVVPHRRYRQWVQFDHSVGRLVCGGLGALLLALLTAKLTARNFVSKTDTAVVTEAA